MRCFIALTLNAGAISSLTRATGILSAAYPALNWVDPKNYHLTLAFLGEQGPAGLACARCALEALREAPAARVRPTRVGSFPPRGPWRVLVVELESVTIAGITGGAGGPGRGSIASIYRRLNERLADGAASAGLAPLNEDWPTDSMSHGKPFRAHITLARRGAGRGAEVEALDQGLLARAEAELRVDMPAGGWPLDACVLYKSELRPSGAVYTELDRATLASL